MVKTCCVKHCNIIPKGNVTCFRFPNNRFLKRKWIDAIGLSNKLTANSLVCIKHFREDDYDMVRGRPRLKAKVIPSVFCESDKKSLLSCITEDDIISNELDSEITLKNIQKNNLNLSDGNIDLQTEVRTELHNDVGLEVRGESRLELLNEENSLLQNGCANVQKEASTALENNSNTTLNCEGRTELQNESTTESQSMVSANVQNERKSEILSDRNDNGQNESSMKSQNEDCTQSKNENIDESTKSRKTKPNGIILTDKSHEKGYQDSFIESTTKRANNVEDLNKDIEDIIINYQIKQTRPLHAAQTEGIELEENGVEDGVEVVDLLKENDPVFIEVAVPGDRVGSPRDCLMVLESVEVELDPSTFLADGEPDDCHETVDLAGDDDDLDLDEDRRLDPISLLTSSDEDEVIIQEPHIDTVEVSDETDEDDMPLVKLLNKPKKKKKPNLSIWNAYQYFCMECQYTATSKQEYRAHTAKHSTILQVCEICDYTTASKSQFYKHKRKHKDDKKFKCHLCEYKARHNMSLIYHLKSHRALSCDKKGYKCDKCGFTSDLKTAVLKHVKLCTTNVKKYSCDKCVYETKRPSDLKRHKARRHSKDQEDDEEFVP